MPQNKTKCVVGPVPSRRLGLSLGIDLLPFKTCSMDCVYCECGATTDLTCERKEYFPTEAVTAEIDSAIRISSVCRRGLAEPKLSTLSFWIGSNVTLSPFMRSSAADVEQEFG